ncbi:hypothetical protein [Bacillus sp. NPDC094106]|uniref:hypothetical protein n=1 Tax=Bacillus sp. NPDC094106 TaxID=3363949 RepID=UPI003827D537
MRIDYQNATVVDYLKLLDTRKQGGQARLFADIRLTCLSAALGFGTQKSNLRQQVTVQKCYL